MTMKVPYFTYHDYSDNSIYNISTQDDEDEALILVTAVTIHITGEFVSKR